MTPKSGGSRKRVRANGSAILAAIMTLSACAPAGPHGVRLGVVPSPEGETLSTLHLFLTGNDTSICLNPLMAHASVDAGASCAKSAPFALSLSKPVLSACLGRQSKGAVFLSTLLEEGRCFDKLSTNG
ncbi:MAG: hypothetical protein CVT74_08820 [Alphaproteobacteria bacterium HGW-Alphaproteobacteria-13]|jgi:hypothetical protein|nr:MAG: hypothetical protein CVT74_08820 [Alphaproteobacteria bacterium HGW-Alphaproteobacteria-13]